MTRTQRLLALLPVFSVLAPLTASEALGAQPCAGDRQTASASCLSGVASWYGQHYQGRKTASGEPFDRMALTAAHPTLPLQTQVRVVDLATGRSVTVRINDRGPGYGRVIDLSQAAARSLGIEARGLARVRIEEIAEGTE